MRQSVGFGPSGQLQPAPVVTASGTVQLHMGRLEAYKVEHYSLCLQLLPDIIPITNRIDILVHHS